MVKQKKKFIGYKKFIEFDEMKKICANCVCCKRITGFRTGWTYLYCQLDVEIPWLDNGKEGYANDTCKHWKIK